MNTEQQLEKPPAPAFSIRNSRFAPSWPKPWRPEALVLLSLVISKIWSLGSRVLRRLWGGLFVGRAEGVQVAFGRF